MAIFAYILVTLVANYTATWFLPLPVFGQVAVGTLFFGATFTLRDHVHARGRRTVYCMIAAAAVLNVCMALILSVPLRIIGASFLSICLAETADTEVYQRLLQRSWWIRVIGSNAVSVPLDSLTFNSCAFAGVFSLGMLAQLVFGEIVIKTLTGALVALWRFRNSSSAVVEIAGSTKFQHLPASSTARNYQAPSTARCTLPIRISNVLTGRRTWRP